MNINVLAAINQLGYGIASLNILDQLVGLGHEVSLFPIGHLDSGQIPADKREMIKRCEANAGFYDRSAPSVKIWHQYALAEHVGYGTQVGFPFFELRQLKPNELHHMRSVDRLVVTSQWASSICEDNGLNKPIIAPLGVDCKIFHKNVKADRLSPDFTTFVNVGKWEVRKGHDVLISAFNKAFGPTDKVILKFAAINPFLGDGNVRWARLCSGSRLGKSIYIHPERLATQNAVAKFLVSADCGVFPSRAEAWNLELLEAMACGLPCIATNYSGHTEYANNYNCRLIEINEFEDAVDGVWFHGQGQWAALKQEQEDQLIHHMREIHRLKQTGGLRTNTAGIDTALRFNWRTTAEKILGIL